MRDLFPIYCRALLDFHTHYLVYIIFHYSLQDSSYFNNKCINMKFILKRQLKRRTKIKERIVLCVCLSGILKRCGKITEMVWRFSIFAFERKLWWFKWQCCKIQILRISLSTKIVRTYLWIIHPGYLQLIVNILNNGK